MLNRQFYVVFVFLFFGVSVFGAVCGFSQENTNCSFVSDSFVDFSVEVADSEKVLVDSVSLQIFERENLKNFLKLEPDSSDKYKFKNVNPLTTPGIYVAKVSVMTKSGVLKKYEKEFVFSPSVASPIVFYDYFVSEGSANFFVKTQFPADRVFVNGEDKGESNSDGNLSFSMSLSRGVHVLSFVSKRGNIESVPVSRIIVVGASSNWDSVFAQSPVIGSGLESKNVRTIFPGDKYVTTKQNFLVTGTSSTMDGFVYVNGLKTPVVLGSFAQEVLLNEGDNEVVVKGSDAESRVSVSFVNFRFKFLEVNLDTETRVFFGDAKTISGKTNYDLPFEVFLNGNFLGMRTPSMGEFSFVLSNQDLKSGRNFLYLKGYNGEEKFYILYKDNIEPEIEVLSSSVVSSGSEFVFKINEKNGYDLSSLRLSFVSSGSEFTAGDLERFGDYYKLSLSDFVSGSYSYTIEVLDYAKNSKSVSGEFVLKSVSSSSDMFFDKIEGLGISVFGSELMVSSVDDSKLVLSPSKRIAFEGIYLDGKEITTYSIDETGVVTVELSGFKEKGVLNMSYVDKLGQKGVLNFVYFSVLETPKLNLDYVLAPYSSGENRVFVSGEILDSNFDMSLLRINSVMPFVLGRYFEGYVLLENGEKNDISFSGSDLSSSPLVVSGVVFEMRGSDLVLNRESVQDSNFVFNGSFSSPLKSFEVSRFDGGVYSDNYVLERFSLPTSGLYGVRSLNFEGFDLSGEKLSSYESFSIDSIAPKIFVYDMGNGNVQVVCDGTLSAVYNVSILVNDELTSVSEVGSYVNTGVYNKAYQFAVSSGQRVKIEVLDVAGNSAVREFVVGTTAFDVVPTYGTLSFGVVYSGMDKYVVGSDYFVSGHVYSNVPLTGVSVVKSSGESLGVCEFDDFGFVCPVNGLVVGENKFKVVPSFYGGPIVDVASLPEVSVWRVQGLGSPSIDLIFKRGVYNTDFGYYLTTSVFDLNATILSDSQVSVLVGGSEIGLGTKEGKIQVLNIDASSVLNSERQVEIQLKVEDEYSQEAYSNILTVTYNKVLSALLWIFVN